METILFLVLHSAECSTEETVAAKQYYAIRISCRTYRDEHGKLPVILSYTQHPLRTCTERCAHKRVKYFHDQNVRLDEFKLAL